MAFGHSIEQIAPLMAKAETTYGTDAAPTGGTDDLLTVRSPIPYQSIISQIELKTHNSTFTKGKNITTARLAQVTFTFFLSGSGSAGVQNVNGYAAIAALFLASGNKEVDVGTTSLTYSPATIASLSTFLSGATRTGSATVWSNINGWTHKVPGCWGNMVIVGNPETGMECTFTGLGKYVDPVAEGSTFSGFTGGTARYKPFLNVGGSINNGAAYTPVFKSFRFDMGFETDRIFDANDPTGLKSIFPADRNPTLQMVIAVDTDASANVAYNEYYADQIADTTHAIAWAVNGGAGNICSFAFPTAQLTNVALGTANRHRTLSNDYKVQHVTPESEWSIAIT